MASDVMAAFNKTGHELGKKCKGREMNVGKRANVGKGFMLKSQ